ncbi:hypothetical protein, partial [Burkholderia gladioli]|uniref:hypothetical protein n=1 Tax=Burkholderia gladioli TaxID=28095 RepID=UPI001ABB1B74
TVHSDAIPGVDAQVIVIAVNIRLRVAIDPYTRVLAICGGSASRDATSANSVDAAVCVPHNQIGATCHTNYISAAVDSDTIPRIDAQAVVIAVDIRLRVAIDPYARVLAICGGSAGRDATSVNRIEVATCVPYNQIGATRRINYIS